MITLYKNVNYIKMMMVNTGHFFYKRNVPTSYLFMVTINLFIFHYLNEKVRISLKVNGCGGW